MPIESETKKLQKKKPELRESALKNSFGNIDYKKEGNVCVENETVRLEIDYSFADPNDFFLELEDYDYMESSFGGTVARREDWRILNRFIVHNKKTNIEIDLLEDLPDQFQILFSPFSKRNNGSARIEDSRCLIWNDISTIDGILTTLHEIGHCVDYKKTPDWEKWLETNIDNAVDKDELNLVLLKERSAWAYALNKIRPLLISGAFPKNEILKNIHGKEGLLSYCQTIREILEATDEIGQTKREKIDKLESEIRERLKDRKIQ